LAYRTEKTTLSGVVGYPIKHSFSPLMHNTAFRELGLKWIYLPFNVHPDLLENAVNGIRGLDIKGVNVTFPHKRTIIPFLGVF